MALKRKVGFFTGLKYNGGGPMWAWVLHRIGISINIIYENWIFQLVLFFLVIFHAVNGLRITILDLWPALLEHQREAIWAQWLVIVPLYGLILFTVFKNALGL